MDLLLRGQQFLCRTEAAILPLQAQAADEAYGSNTHFGAKEIPLLVHFLRRAWCSGPAGGRSQCCCARQWPRFANCCTRQAEHGDGPGLDPSEEVHRRVLTPVEKLGRLVYMFGDLKYCTSLRLYIGVRPCSVPTLITHFAMRFGGEIASGAPRSR